MEKILSNQALEGFNRDGYVRTNIRLSQTLTDEIRRHFKQVSPQASNWSFFYLNSLHQYALPRWQILLFRLKKMLAAKALHKAILGRQYDKTIFGSTDLLPSVLNECIANNIGTNLGDVPLLVGHDIYLENSRDRTSFGFHEDGFGWDSFYQSGDDLSFYIPLVDLTEETGGRLHVEQNGDKTVRYRDWNRRILEFAEFCQSVGSVDQRGLVTKEAILQSNHRKRIAIRFTEIIDGRKNIPRPQPEQLQPINFKAGEVILFNNKRYHDIEPWLAEHRREVYIIRCVPLYDLGLAPPSHFLNKVPCNRYLLKDRGRTLIPFSPDAELPTCHPVPVD